MFNVYIVSICVFSVRAHLIWSLALLCVPHLRPSFFVCCSNVFFPLVFFSIVITVKAIKYINKINKSDRAGGTGAEPTHTQVP